MEHTAETFWTTVKRMSKEKGLTQDVICQNCNIPISTFRHWIIRDVFPDAFQTYKIAKLLNTSVEYLLTGEENSVKPDTSELEKTLNLALSQLKNL